TPDTTPHTFGAGGATGFDFSLKATVATTKATQLAGRHNATAALTLSAFHIISYSILQPLFSRS
ncbi:MAG: hypothetical protein WBQ92_14210, partial [Pseudomonas alloputida]